MLTVMDSRNYSRLYWNVSVDNISVNPMSDVLITDVNKDINKSTSDSYMILLEDIDEYIGHLNFTIEDDLNNITFSDKNCSTSANISDLICISQFNIHLYNYWALILILFPIFTLFGNVLVILSVYRERTLQTATNYFIVSLALADMLVAVMVMPFAVYVLVNGTWTLPGFICDFYIAMDVTCSTSSIFNLVAISIDRYIAVTQPIKYAKHKNNRRVWLTIVLVWFISVAIGSPIVLGLNNTPDRVADACLFYNSDFIIYSSLSSFYIPCIIMMFLYYNIFKVLSRRAMQARLNRKPLPSEIKPGSVIENVATTRTLAETALGPAAIEELATNTGSGSGEEDDDPVDNECQIISNDKSTEFILATVVEEAAISSVVASFTASKDVSDTNGNNDPVYVDHRQNEDQRHENMLNILLPKSKNGSTLETDLRTALSLNSATATQYESSSGSKKERKALTAAARFTIYKVNKASRKKREKFSAKKERKATKTLAIVLGVFLICWVPFFTCNIMDAMCSKLGLSCQPGFAVFLLTTWLGYMNSFVNPVIYTIFNPEFRKAFKKIMKMKP